MSDSYFYQFITSPVNWKKEKLKLSQKQYISDQ